MTPTPEGEGWQVVVSQMIAAQIRKLHLQADRQGRGEEVIQAMERIRLRLSNDPEDFGEPMYRLPAARMQIRHAVVRPLVVDFGVCEGQPIVFLKGIKLLSHFGK